MPVRATEPAEKPPASLRGRRKKSATRNGTAAAKRRQLTDGARARDSCVRRASGVVVNVGLVCWRRGICASLGRPTSFLGRGSFFVDASAADSEDTRRCSIRHGPSAGESRRLVLLSCLVSRPVRACVRIYMAAAQKQRTARKRSLTQVYAFYHGATQ